MLKSKRINTAVEEKILTGAIVSTDFCRDILPLVKKRYLQVPYISRIIEWVKTYYRKYEEAPGKTIQDIFTNEKSNIDPSEVEIIETFLTRLSEEYERQDIFNVSYYEDIAEKYFKERGASVLSEDVKQLVEAGEVDKAEKIIRNYKEVAKSVSNWKNPFDEKFIDKVFTSERKNYLFSFDGELGKLLGGFKRDWLVSVMAPEKRGKTFFLMEIAVHAVLSRLRTVFISLEMSDEDIGERIFRRIVSERLKDGDVVFPCFDCYKNQDGSCNKKERKNRITLLNEEGKRPEYSVEMEYKVCTFCRGKKEGKYIPAYWFVTHKKKKLSAAKTKKRAKALERMYGDNFRLIAYPVRQANLARIRNDLETLEYTENFIPDVIVIDYADILASEDSRIVGRDSVNETWMMLKSLAQERHVVVFTGSQTTKISAETKNVTSSSVSEDKRKRAHVDCIIFLSQTPEEKDDGVMRVSTYTRHASFNEYKQVQILQQLDLSQVVLDSDWVVFREKSN